MFLGESNPDRISKSAAWEAKLCHLHLQELLRCCEIPFQSRAQGCWLGKERKSYLKHVWQLKFCWQQCHITSLVEEVNPLEEWLHNLALWLRHVLLTGHLYRHLAEPRNNHSCEGNFYAKQSSKTCLKISTNSNKGHLSLLWEWGMGRKRSEGLPEWTYKIPPFGAVSKCLLLTFWLERAKNKY